MKIATNSRGLYLGDPAAYQSHLETPYFQTYKQSTLHMVKTLELLEMRPMNPKGIWEILKKLQ